MNKILLLPCLLVMACSTAPKPGPVSRHEKKMREIASVIPPTARQANPMLSAAAVNLVDDGGEIVLFHQQGEDVLIKSCTSYSVIETVTDCTGDTKEHRILVKDLKTRLKMALRIYSLPTFTEIPDVDLKQVRDQALQKKKNLEDFIEFYGKSEKRTTVLADLNKRYQSADEAIRKKQDYRRDVAELNMTIDHIVNQFVGDKILATAQILKPGEQSFVYALMRTVLSESPLRSVFVQIPGTPLEISTTEYTQLEWMQFPFNSNFSRFTTVSDCPESQVEIRGQSVCPDLPMKAPMISQLEWFLGVLNEYDKSFRYRLPTVKEWVAAANGMSFADQRAVAQAAWYAGNSGTQSQPIASKQPNSLEVYDLAGNVSELAKDESGSWMECGGSFEATWEQLATPSCTPSPAKLGASSGFRLVRERR